MPYQVFQFGNFSGGLNLRDKTDVVRDDQAIDLLNVEFTDVGAVRQRDGYVELTGTALTSRVDSLAAFYTASGTKQLLAGCGTRLEGVNTSGAVVASATGLAGGPYTFARFAAPGAETAYAGNGTDTLRKWDGSAWSAPTATVNGVAAQPMPEAGAICVTANSNRLLATGFGTNTAGGPDALPSNPSRGYFSEPGNPENWEAGDGVDTGNWVDWHPGDGEQVMNAVTWRDRTFVFKETKFFVLGPERPDSTGEVIFDWYAVDSGVGLAARPAVCVARDGVYFMGRQGVYFTNGSEPRLLSELVEPMWRGGASVYFRSDEINHAQLAKCRMAWHDERLYLAVPTGSSTTCNRVLVHDLTRGWWSLYDIPASALVSFRRGDQPELHFGYAAGDNEIGYVSSGASDDDGAAITSRWRSGWFDYNAGTVKRIRESKMWGTGAVVVKFSKDFEQTPNQTAQVLFSVSDVNWPSSGTWAAFLAANGGVWPGGGEIIAELVRKAVRGTVFSTEFSMNEDDATWSIHRVSRHLAGQKVPTATD